MASDHFTLDKGAARGSVTLPSSEWPGMNWTDIKKNHETEFNPSGVVGRRREADTSVETLLGCTRL